MAACVAFSAAPLFSQEGGAPAEEGPGAEDLAGEEAEESEEAPEAESEAVPESGICRPEGSTRVRFPAPDRVCSDAEAAVRGGWRNRNCERPFWNYALWASAYDPELRAFVTDEEHIPSIICAMESPRDPDLSDGLDESVREARRTCEAGWARLRYGRKFPRIWRSYRFENVRLGPDDRLWFQRRVLRQAQDRFGRDRRTWNAIEWRHRRAQSACARAEASLASGSDEDRREALTAFLERREEFTRRHERLFRLRGGEPRPGPTLRRLSVYDRDVLGAVEERKRDVDRWAGLLEAASRERVRRLSEGAGGPATP